MTEDEDFDIEAAELGRRRLAAEIDVDHAASAANEGIKRLAERIVQGRVDPMRGCMAAYTWTWMAGAWDDGDPLPDLRHLGAEFLQLSDALEFNRKDPKQTAAMQALIRVFAEAVIDGTPPPAWRLDNRGRLVPATE